ncbi:MAG: hypothetical protein RLY47_312, partial [Candidatus Parcubacteria bacterium]
MELNERITLLSNQKAAEARTGSISFMANEYGPDAQRLNKALQASSSTEDRKALLNELLTLWRASGSRDEAEQAALLSQKKDVFGSLYEQFGEKSLMCTMPTSQRQFRVWYEFPGALGTGHVDSWGTGCLLSVGGHPEVVAEYATM